jgi:hypothetical protein
VRCFTAFSIHCAERSGRATEVAIRPDPNHSFCVTVLGAGRSGTSAITRALPAIGIELGNNIRRARGKNPTGFWEDRDLLSLNKQLKRALGIRGDSVRLIEDEEWRQPTLRAIHDRAVEMIRRRFGPTPRWGYKYGRTLRLLPFWLEVFGTLGLELRYVVALRNPLSVARSRGQLDQRRGTQEKSDLEWLVNVVPYFQLVRGRNLVTVDYDLLVADPAVQLERMAERLGVALDSRDGIREYCEEFLRPGMRHSRFTVEELAADQRIHPLVRRAYGGLYRLATDEISTTDAAFWQEWGELTRELDALKPLLIHIDRVQADLLRAQRSLLGPLQAVPEIWRRIQAK